MVLQRGSSGPEVVELQNRLRILGWALTRGADGVFGLETDAAVRQSQRALGLVTDGIVGPVTSSAFASSRSSLPPVRSVVVPPRVRYRSQRDNAHLPSSTCNVTSYADLLDSQGVPEPSGKQLEDLLYELIMSPEGAEELRRSFPWAVGKVAPQTVHGMLVWAAGKLGVRTRFTTTATWADIIREVSAGRPVVLAGRFTASGHLVFVAGLASAFDLIVHDPWGDWNRGYRATDGEARIYTREALTGSREPRLAGGIMSDGNIWAHFLE